VHNILHHHEIFGVLIVRLFLGILFFLQGYDAVFKVKISGVIQTIEEPMLRIGMPRFLIVISAYFTSYIELIGGILLIIGFAKYYAMYLLGIDLIVASIAFGMIKSMWDMQYVFPRLVILVFLLIIPSQWDVFSVDYVWSIIKFIKSISP